MDDVEPDPQDPAELNEISTHLVWPETGWE